MSRVGLVALLSTCVALSACGSEDDSGESAEVGEWQGEVEHLKAEGAIGGRTLSLDVNGADAKNLEVLFCERNYVAGRIEKVELKHNFEFDGEPAELEVTFVAFDYSMKPAGSIAVGGASEDAPTADKINVELKIETLETMVELEDVAASGTFTLQSLTGTPGSDGLIPSGQGDFAGYLDAELESGDKLQISFTVRCGDNDVG
jgi:hypothetical protein